MKDIMCPVAAGVVLVSCMNDNRNSSSDESVAAAIPDREVEISGDEQAIHSLRHSLFANKSFSTNARDVRLFVTESTITLRGIVKSEKEKIGIGALARQFAGAKQIDNQLQVAESVAAANPGHRYYRFKKASKSNGLQDSN